MDGLSLDDRFALPPLGTLLERDTPRIVTRVREEVRFLGDVVEITEVVERSIEGDGRRETLPSKIEVREIPEDPVESARTPGELLDFLA